MTILRMSNIYKFEVRLKRVGAYYSRLVSHYHRRASFEINAINEGVIFPTGACICAGAIAGGVQYSPGDLRIFSKGW